MEKLHDDRCSSTVVPQHRRLFFSLAVFRGSPESYDRLGTLLSYGLSSIKIFLLACSNDTGHSCSDGT